MTPQVYHLLINNLLQKQVGEAADSIDIIGEDDFDFQKVILFHEDVIYYLVIII